MQADTNVATELLANAFTLSDESFIEPLRERFEAAVERIDRNLDAQRTLGFYEEAAPIYTRLFELGTGEDSIFNVFARELQIVEQQGELLALNRDISVDLVEEVDGLVSAAEASAAVATQASTQAIFTGRTLLLVISGLSIIGATANYLAVHRQGAAAAAGDAFRMDAPDGRGGPGGPSRDERQG